MAHAGVEIEVKLRAVGADDLRRRLRRLGAQRLGRVHERNILFDTPENNLKHSGRLLRVRSLEPVGPASRPTRRGRRRARRADGLLTFKGTPRLGSSSYKVREEVEVAVADPEIARKIFMELGFVPWFRYEKYRTSFRLPGLPRLAVELDETPIGTFLELEGPRESIDRAAKRLGFGPEDYIVASYYELFLPERRRLGLPADAMLFPASPKSISPLFS